MRWKLYAILNPGIKSKKSFGFNTTNSPPQFKELKPFEDDMFAMIKGIQFRSVKSRFQGSLKEKVTEIRNTPEIIVKADKTTNLYKMSINIFCKKHAKF